MQTTGRRATPLRRFTRRALLRAAALGGVAATLGAACGESKDTKPPGGKVTVPRTNIPAVGAAPYKDDEGKFYLINNDDGALALYWKCTHQGCMVPWKDGESRFHCPCHGSTFDRHGVRTGGPAKRPLDLMALSFDANGNAIIDTGQITTRDEYTPDQPVRLPG